MELTGHIHVIHPRQDVSDNYEKQEVVIKTEGQYPQYITVSFFQDKCNLLNPYVEGDYVTIRINLRGREWVNPQGETKYFNEISGYSIFQPQN